MEQCLRSNSLDKVFGMPQFPLHWRNEGVNTNNDFTGIVGLDQMRLIENENDILAYFFLQQPNSHF